LDQRTTVLGIESSCDDTAAAVVRGFPGAKADVLSSVVFGQTELHSDFGGVVPEIAARAHAEKLDFCVEAALTQANMTLSGIDAIAVTAGPGLIGGVVSGVMCAKGLSLATGKPLYGINHLAGHALTPRLTDQVPYPYLLLLVSGGHCQFLICHTAKTFERLGGTIDDAPGEAFDKTARLLGLPQPGGPSVEAAALSGNPDRFPLPRPLLDRPGCDMSFSGLKTAVLRARDAVIAEQGGLRETDRADLSAAFQASVVDVLAHKTARALEIYLELRPDTASLCIAGGVAANTAVRNRLDQVSSEYGAQCIAPPLALCTDNAAMIAYAALEQMQTVPPDDMTLSARPRWPLDHRQPAMLGSGKKGPKA
jgi:N6-L-threonylcarbamoyladenine synthase